MLFSHDDRYSNVPESIFAFIAAGLTFNKMIFDVIIAGLASFKGFLISTVEFDTDILPTNTPQD